jgi:hypothetical protein
LCDVLYLFSKPTRFRQVLKSEVFGNPTSRSLEKESFMTRHGHYPLRGDNPPKSTYYEQGKFGRMFPTLPSFATDTPSVRNARVVSGPMGLLTAGCIALKPRSARSPDDPQP